MPVVVVKLVSKLSLIPKIFCFPTCRQHNDLLSNSEILNSCSLFDSVKILDPNFLNIRAITGANSMQVSFFVNTYHVICLNMYKCLPAKVNPSVSMDYLKISQAFNNLASVLLSCNITCSVITFV